MQLVRLNHRETLAIAGISQEALKSMRRRDQIAMAFSADDIVSFQTCSPLDAVALMLSTALART